MLLEGAVVKAWGVEEKQGGVFLSPVLADHMQIQLIEAAAAV